MNCWIWFFVAYGAARFAVDTWNMLSRRRSTLGLTARLRQARLGLEARLGPEAFASEENPFPQTYVRLPSREDRRDAR